MKYFCFFIILGLFVFGCKPKQGIVSLTHESTTNKVVIDLVNVNEDKVKVKLYPSKINAESVVFSLPKIIPGTYSSDNYGKFISNLKAYTKQKKALPVTRINVNSWEISQANQLHRLIYLVDDTFDNEAVHKIFSPSGTNILKNKNYLLNLHGFVGYFNETKEQPYLLSVLRSKNIQKATSRPEVFSHFLKPKNNNTAVDSFRYPRYAELIDDPILYASQDIETFKLNDIEVQLSVYSPNQIHTAKSLLPTIKRMMSAQKNFMGTINTTKKYSIILYLSEFNKTDAGGFGALEHNNSTVVVLPERIPKKALEESLIDIVAHEFFHIITPLTIHSEEIHHFDFSKPKMSEHLWMYEGTTEYFAQLFQVKEGLISKEEFLKRLVEKLETSYTYNDRMSFTKMSKHILKNPYKKNFNNVYYKGALISMCLDIIIRKQSNGEKGILDIMKLLSNSYGPKKPFLDKELIEIFTLLSYPEVGLFLERHVVKSIPIDYAHFFAEVGLKYNNENSHQDYFMENEQVSYLKLDKDNNQILFGQNVIKSDFFKKIGIKENDVLVAVNGQKYDLNNVAHLYKQSKKWKKGHVIIFTIIRNGNIIIKEEVIKNTIKGKQHKLIEIPELELTKEQVTTKNSWLNYGVETEKNN